ncbi:MAG: rhomboid family intramembrane serine protease [bacterium]
MIPLRDDVRAERRPWATYSLVAFCAVVYGLQFFGDASGRLADAAFIREYGMIPADVVAGRNLWTLVTSMFLHGGLFHFLGNMLYLWIFGDNVEDAFGHVGYLAVYLVTGLAGSLLQIAAAPSSTIPTIGASGAISGVMGAYFILFPRARVLTLVPIFFFLRFIYLPAPLLLGFWILFQVLNGCSSAPGSGGVAYFAHIGGFAAGALFGLLARKRVRRPWYEIR